MRGAGGTRLTSTRRRVWGVVVCGITACSSTGPGGDPDAVDRVDVQPSQHTLELGVNTLVQLNATPRNASGTALPGLAVGWRSDASTVATVDGDGLVTAVGLGSTSIRATVSGVEGSATITVAPPSVATVSVSLGHPVVVAGGATTASAIVRDAAGNTLERPVDFSSSNAAVATVSPQGQVTGVATGTATITATSESRMSSVALCVLGAPPNLRVEQVLLSQAIQRPAGDIPLIAGGNPAGVTIFATSSTALPAGCLTPRIRAIVYAGPTEVTRTEVSVTSALPTTLDVTMPSAGFVLGRQYIGASLRVLVEVDPHGVFPETNDADNAWPSSGVPAQMSVVAVPPLELRVVPIHLTNGGSVGQVTEASMAEYLYATRQVYPISDIDWEIAEPFASTAIFGSGAQAPWLQMLAELDVRRVVEGSRRYYIGSVRPPSGVTSTQFGGFGYVPVDLASQGPATRTSVLVGVGWFNRQRQTTELVAHELGHNHGRRHGPCGGAADPDPAFPYVNARIGFPGTDMYTWSLNAGAPPELTATGAFDIMSYCVPAWISDYNYEALLAARLAAGPHDPVAAGAPCDCLVAWGTVDSSGITINPAFTVRTRVQLPGAGSHTIEGVRADGSLAFSHAFESAEIDHAHDVRHFALAIPASAADLASLTELRVRGPRGMGVLRRGSAVATSAMLRQSAATTSLRQTSSGATITWPGSTFRAALVRSARTGAVLALSTDGTVTLPGNPEEVDVVLSDGVRSETVRVRREPR